MIRILPCPFCGAEAFMWAAYGGFRISCKDGCVTIPSRPDVSFSSEEVATKHWNKRLDKEIYEKDEELKRLRKELGRLRAMTQAFGKGGGD